MPDWLPEAASSYAGKIDGLLIMITVIVGVWFIAAEGLLVYMALRYRRREGQKAAYLPGRTLRAMAWVLVPCAVILVLDLVIDAAAAPVWAEIKEEMPPHDRLVRITGAQWMWTFQYAGPDGLLDTDDDFETINELHAPINEVVHSVPAGCQGRVALVLGPAAAAQAGRGAGPEDPRLVQGHARGDLSGRLRRDLRRGPHDDAGHASRGERRGLRGVARLQCRRRP
jgi:hypothetical protein